MHCGRLLSRIGGESEVAAREAAASAAGEAFRSEVEDLVAERDSLLVHLVESLAVRGMVRTSRCI